MGKFIDLESKELNCRLCVTDMYSLAEELTELDEVEVNNLYEYYLNRKDGEALSCIALAASINDQTINRKTLIDSVQWLKQIVYSAPQFKRYGETVVDDLLPLIANDDYPLMIQLYFCDLALDTCFLYGLDSTELVSRIELFQKQVTKRVHRSLIKATLERAEKNQDKENPKIQIIEATLEELLPQEAPKSITGGDYTVRRAVEKIGRNDPCHCGSGKKYKKCCYETDQELQRDASHHAGVTKSELKANPSIVKDGLIIEQMSPAELLELDITVLEASQLYTANHQFHIHEFYDRSYDCIVRLMEFDEEQMDANYHDADPELREMGYEPESYVELNNLLMQRLFNMGLKIADRELVEKIARNSDMTQWLSYKEELFKADVLLNPEKYKVLKDAIAYSMREDKDDDPLAEFCEDFSYDVADCLSKSDPEIAVLFARSSIISKIDAQYYTPQILRLIHKARSQMSLDPWGDPAENVCDLLNDKFKDKESHEIHNAQLEYLTEELSNTQKELAQAKKELLGANQELANTAKRKKASKKPAVVVPKVAPEATPAEKKLVKALQSKVNDLKAIISDQTSERQEMRKELASATKKVASLQSTIDQLMVAEEQSDENGDIDESIENVQLEPKGKIILPEYSSVYKKSCGDFPKAIVAKSISMVGRLASHDDAVWQSLKPLKMLPDFYRIKLSQDFRLMLKWQPGDTLEVLEIIPRQELEHWIKQRV